jgi:hypothetical protein
MHYMNGTIDNMAQGEAGRFFADLWQPPGGGVYRSGRQGGHCIEECSAEEEEHDVQFVGQ